MEHDIEKTVDGFTCTVCKWSWKSKPQSNCPGVVRYERHQAPEHLKTKSQLHKMSLHPGVSRGIVGEHRLYDVSEAIPFTGEEIEAEKERIRKNNQRKCLSCGETVSRRRFDEEYGVCNKCLPKVIAQREERERQMREDCEREFQEMKVRDRDQAILWARGLVRYPRRWVIVDVETTGLDWQNDEIISISIVGLQKNILMSSLLKPTRTIPPEASAVNGITDEMVAGSMGFEAAFPLIRMYLEGRKVIAYNEDFDRLMLYGNCYRHGFASPWVAALKYSPWECAMRKYAAFVGEWSNYFGGYRWQKLPKGDHTAAGDCFATLAIINEMAEAKLSKEE